MANITLIASLGASLLVMTGCRTNMAVNFGNGTAGKVRVQSSQTGQEIEVAPDHFKKLPHSSGDLVVTSEGDRKVRFTNVAPFDIDRNYLSIGRSIFGPNSVTLNVKLETNMALYVVMPGKKAVDPTVEQPSGYPNAGTKVAK